MSGPDHETLTAALRRLADEHASGLLSVATPGRDVVIELAAGTPVTIGPVHDVRDRTGEDAHEDVTAAVVVDELVDRTVAAVVGGHVEWSWDVDSSVARVPLPNGLVQELARRAVDAAQALRTADADTVLQPGEDLEATGELDRVRRLFDGERTVAEVAEAAGLTLPTVATMAAALVEGGALHAPDVPAGDQEDEVVHEDEAVLDRDDGPAGTTWTDTVAATDDEDDDEPELWVMGPSEDDDSGGDEVPASEEASTSVVEPVRLTADADVVVVEEHEDDEAGGDEAAAATSAGEWNDTSWLDELAPQDADDEDEPLFDTEEHGSARAALGSMLEDLQGSAPTRPASDDDGDDDRPGPTEPLDGGEPKAEPGDVAEFLRELSRLALDDD